MIHRQRTTSQMINHRTRHHLQDITRILHPPTQINFLHVGKKTLIQPTTIYINLPPHTQSRPTTPKHGYFIIILSRILFRLSQDSSPAKREAITVYISSTGSGIFKIIPPFPRSQLRLYRSHFRTLIQCFNQWLQHPAFTSTSLFSKTTYSALICAIARL